MNPPIDSHGELLRRDDRVRLVGTNRTGYVSAVGPSALGVKSDSVAVQMEDDKRGMVTCAAAMLERVE